MSARSINALALLEKLNDRRAIYTTNEIISGARAVYPKKKRAEDPFDLVNKINVSVLVNMQICMDV